MPDASYLIRDAKTHERLGTVTDATNAAARFGRRGRDDVYIDAYCAEDRAKLDEWVNDNRR